MRVEKREPGPMDNGRAGMAIAPDGSYILSTLLYPISTFSNGAWKSAAPLLAEESSWRRISVPGVQDRAPAMMKLPSATHRSTWPACGSGEGP